MTSYIQSSSFETKQVLVGPGQNVAIDIAGTHYPVDFIQDGGPAAAQFLNGRLLVQNFSSGIGAAVQFQVPVNGTQKTINIAIYEIGEGGRVYRNIIWSVY